jgi:hypothetical protein
VYRFPGAFRLPAFASWSSLPAGGLGLPHGRLTGPCHQEPDPNGIVTLCMQEIRPGRVPSMPRGRWCSHGRNGIIGRHLPLLRGQSLYPGATNHHPGPSVTRHHRGFMEFTLPAFPSPVTPDGMGVLGLVPRASHPAVTSSACRGGDRQLSTSPDLRR